MSIDTNGGELPFAAGAKFEVSTGKADIEKTRNVLLSRCRKDVNFCGNLRSPVFAMPMTISIVHSNDRHRAAKVD
ncbi:MAG: hypothetical protein ACI9PU_000374 [Ascidiaceihabitans sp.]|jgi:hypothetical protein